jgi:4'-phosphopantetheinyl transferase
VSISVFLIALEGEARAAEGLLDAQELGRANRFRFPHLRERFVLAHGVLRLLLGRFAKEDPRSLRFAIGEKGKPRLEHRQVTFNLSHSGAFAAYALAESLEVGIDVEEMRVLTDLEQLARRSFSVGECADLFTLDGDARLRGFYDCWTRKEAIIKALGLGLSYPLDRFRVSLRPDEPPAVLEIEGGAAEEWQVHPLDVAQGYAGALAYRGERRTVEVTHRTAASVLDEFGLTGDIGSQDFQRTI